MADLSPRYRPQEVEAKWYQRWKDRGYFKPGEGDGPPFVIVLPPPNVTGILHLGHALNNTWQDILIRFHRMRGDRTLWVPGIDHAGIHTQMKVEELLRSRGQDRREMGRDAFLAEVWKWKDQYGDEILRQIERLGASVDWSRLRFTLDERLSRAVTEVFVRLYEEGLIYRGNYIINWCVQCKTALSDIEVDHEEVAGHLTYIRYPLTDEEGAAVVVATTRPETMLGDTAVAVHPDDPRYRDWVGRTVRLPLLGREIPIVADAHVDPEYGTGAVKVTPAHDPNDFAIGGRHQLPAVKVIGEDGRMTMEAGAFAGLDRGRARDAVLEALDDLGLIERREAITHAVGHCQKCGQVIEPLLSLQWFVRVEPLAQPAREAVRSGAVQIIPERFEKIYQNWMENIHDWCISRQIWWGHRIPAYYCDGCGEVVVARSAPDSCPACGGRVRQDEDVLDTWFSSALWPFSTLGWPDDTKDFADFYPTSVLSTGYDILFFWVARMVMQGLHFTGRPPFFTVLLHGLIRDAQGRKMSKSLGNGVNPNDVIDQYGVDALRIALVLGSAPGNDIRYAEERVTAGAHFANKVYNAVRFVLMSVGEHPVSDPGTFSHPAERYIWQRLDDTVAAMTAAIERYEFGEAARAIYDFWWDDFCDWYIELAKIRLKSGIAAAAIPFTLTRVAARALELLHPFMPFVSEELWQHLPHRGESIMTAPWPRPSGRGDEGARELVGQVTALVRTGRNLRAELNLNPGQRVSVICVADRADTLDGWKQFALEVGELLRADRVEFVTSPAERPQRAIAGVTEGGTVIIPLSGVVDLDREAERLKKARAEYARELDRVEAKLGDAQFRQKAPEKVVADAEAKREELQGKLRRTEERLRDLE